MRNYIIENRFTGERDCIQGWTETEAFERAGLNRPSWWVLGSYRTVGDCY